jgi:MoaA/NifB/PqqE/SkfB family radical SAM enzyme
VPGHSLTLLWALRSHCASHSCLYCYFGTVQDHRDARPAAPGALSHLSPDDMTTREILAFARTLGGSAVRRVFLAGGEPLLWRPITRLIEILKAQGLDVVVCTSGVALAGTEISAALVGLGVDAVSVSLDSADPVYNDTWRPPHRDGYGWDRVRAGIATLLSCRAGLQRPRVGIYSVITRLNIADITAVPRLAARLGCDYAVPQPVSLPAGHKLAPVLGLAAQHLDELRREFTTLYAAGLTVRLPAPSYPGQVAAAVRSPAGLVPGCFGGHTLYFIEPDGSVWDCPSSMKIAATPAGRRRSIRDADAGTLFAASCSAARDCALFSVDCVNMWPLNGFDAMLAAPTEGRS